MTLANIAACLGQPLRQAEGKEPFEITGAVLDSRKVEPGYAFFATRGERIVQCARILMHCSHIFLQFYQMLYNFIQFSLQRYKKYCTCASAQTFLSNNLPKIRLIKKKVVPLSDILYN